MSCPRRGKSGEPFCIPLSFHMSRISGLGYLPRSSASLPGRLFGQAPDFSREGRSDVFSCGVLGSGQHRERGSW